MDRNVIEIKDLSRRFGKKTALEGIQLEVPQGVVLGLVGENGAGKTTLIKHLLGLLKAQTGQVRVFGLDPVREPEAVLGRIGFLSENREMPEWMRIRELMRYTAAYYPSWDPGYAAELVQRFELDPNQKIKHLSRGERAKTGLLMALAYRPELLLFDEPSSGLDPVVRRDMLTAIVKTLSEQGRTVVFSSHLLDEVERVADRVAMIHEGRLVLEDTLEAILAGHHRVTLRFDQPQASRPHLSQALSCTGGPLEWTCVCNGGLAQFQAQAAGLGACIVEQGTPSLDEIFVARVRG